MKNTQNLITIESITNGVWRFLSKIRAPTSFLGGFNSIVAVLYGFHRGYYNKTFDILQIELVPNDDQLLRDLWNSIPDDRVLRDAMRGFIRDFSFLNNESGKRGEGEFNRIYLDVLERLFHLVCTGGGRAYGEFYTPKEVTKLMSYLVKKEDCASIYDPFCGSASIIKELPMVHFEGQDVDHNYTLYARLFVEGITGNDSGIKQCDSINCWNEGHFDAVVSCPPLGCILNKEQYNDSKFLNSEFHCKSLVELIISNAFSINNAKVVVTLMTMGTLFGGVEDKKKREFLIEHNLVDTVISLPGNVLYNTSIASCIVVCKKYRKENDPVKFIHAENYFTGEGNQRSFDFDNLVKMIEGDACDCAEVSIDEIRQYDYNLDPSLYYKKNFDLKEGQRIVKLEDLVSKEDEYMPVKDVHECVTGSLLSSNFIDILLKDGEQSPSPSKPNSPGFKFLASDNKYLLTTIHFIAGEHRYGLNTKTRDFVVQNAIQVFKINEDLVIPEYLVYILTNNSIVHKGRMSLYGYMKYPIVIDSLERQKEIVESEKQKYYQKINAEREADAKRLGVKQNISDLEHMLSLTQTRIYRNISKLENATPASEKYSDIVKSLKDNIDYMNRVIRYNSSSLDPASFNKKEENIIDFIQNYVSSWYNYGGECFELVVDNEVDEVPVMSFDKAMLTVMLDSILNNALRHSFKKRKDFTDHNTVQIGMSIVEYNEKQYMLLSVANNGSPIADGFTIEDYISKGRYSASSGRSGLGGFHVYQIVKGHDGFLYLDSNKMWNVIIDVLLPIDSTSLNIKQYDKDCI